MGYTFRIFDDVTKKCGIVRVFDAIRFHRRISFDSHNIIITFPNVKRPLDGLFRDIYFSAVETFIDRY